MTIWLAMIFLTIFRFFKFEFIYVMILTFIFHYIAFAIIHVLLNAKASEYNKIDDVFKVKNGISILAIAVMMAFFINNPSEFHLSYILIPIISELLTIVLVKKTYYDWKRTLMYGFLLDAKASSYAILVAILLEYIDQFGIPVAIIICFGVGFVASLVNKMFK